MTVKASQLKRPLTTRLREDRELLRVQGSKATLARSGMSVTAENEVTVDGDLVVDGTLNVTGNTVIGGTLSLPAGIINNDALAQPVVPGVLNVRATSFSLPIAYTEVASVDVAIPDGCTRVLANMTGWVQGYNVKTTGGNNGAGGDYIYARVKVGSTQSASNMPAGVSGSGGTSCATMGLGVLLTGLTPGGTLHFAVMGATDYVIAAHANNDALLTGTLIWLR